jgi:hypothetical protein
MIIAEIGHAQFLLENIDAAEKLLRILNNSKQISSTYIGTSSKRVFYENPSQASIEISIHSEVEILSYDEFIERRK